jgi:hypothetical protein
VSLFGPGYGEAIAIHVGNGRWLLIDSCTCPGSSTPLHLDYLNSIGVDPAASVALVVVSHWHDDHVRGVFSVVRECRSARVVLSSALRSKEFFAIANLYADQIPEGSGVDELARVLRHLLRESRGGPRGFRLQFATVDRTLLNEKLGSPGSAFRASVFSLSPSDAAIYRSKEAFTSLLPAGNDERRRIAPVTPNDTCVVILVEVCSDVLLFGSDLQSTHDSATGWSAVLACSIINGRRAQVFKLPHHGGESAHDARVWADLLVKSPWAILTPFQRGAASLPSDGDVSRILGLTANAFTTGLPSRRRWRPQERVVAEMVGEATKSINDIPVTAGHIRLRKSVSGTDLAWTVELFGGARQLSSSPRR